MKYAITLLLLSAGLSLSASNGKIPRKIVRDSLPVLTERCEKVLKAAYMAQTYLGEDRNLSGWEGYPVKLYEYKTGYDSTACARKTGKVYLLNPTPEQLARWIMTAVWEVKGNLDFASTEKLRKQVLYQSGAQFPVSGVVYEAMYKPGDYYPYLFKDGVTVWLADSTYFSKDHNPNAEQLDFYLHMKTTDLKPRVGSYARICSTTPEQYTAAGGKEPVGTNKQAAQHWLYVVRKLYQQAWNSDRNELMVIWAKANL